MKTFKLNKAITTKLFMLLAFSIFALVMYQGYLTNETIYVILFYGSLILCAFQIASIFYVSFIKKSINVTIDGKNFIWEVYENSKKTNETVIALETIKELNMQINYLTGNIYSSLSLTIDLKDGNIVELTDGLLYDFGLKMAEELSIFLLENNLGHPQDIKFLNFVKQLNIDLSKEQIFNKKQGDDYLVGVISKNKKEFLALRLQIETLYDFKNIEKNANNEYLVKNDKDGFIYLRSNAIGYFIQFHKVKQKEELKTLKQMGKRNKIGF